MPCTRNRRGPRSANMQYRSHAASSRRNRNKSRPRRSRHSTPRSSRMAWLQSPRGSAQHLALAADAALARAQQPRKHLAVHASELVVEPHLQILRRHRRSLLLQLEHAHRSALENHVHCSPRLGNRRSPIVRIGIILTFLSSLAIIFPNADLSEQVDMLLKFNPTGEAMPPTR